MKLKLVRGMKDIIGNDSDKFFTFVDEIKKFSKMYNYQELILPILEYNEIFHRTLGEDSDIINKEIYNFIDRGKNFLTLRPEFTASTVRSLITNNLFYNLPLKLFSYGPLFRHERPQKGRLRQFYQYNFEYIGSLDIRVDIELVQLAQNIIDFYSLNKSITLHINHLGNKIVRGRFKKALFNYFNKYKNDLNDTDIIRLKKNPIRILDSKDKKINNILLDAPSLKDFLDPSEKSEFSKIQQLLCSLRINFKISEKLVRGIDYYSGFVFEFINNHLSSQSTILAGGRYNNLIGQMCGKIIPAAGFAGGVERFLSLINKTNSSLIKFLLIPIGKDAENISCKILYKLRNSLSLNVEQYYGLNLKKTLYKADKNKFDYCLFFGDQEIKNNNFRLKNMLTGKEEIISFEYLINKKIYKQVKFNKTILY